MGCRLLLELCYSGMLPVYLSHSMQFLPLLSMRANLKCKTKSLFHVSIRHVYLMNPGMKILTGKKLYQDYPPQWRHQSACDVINSESCWKGIICPNLCQHGATFPTVYLMFKLTWQNFQPIIRSHALNYAYICKNTHVIPFSHYFVLVSQLQ